MKIKYITFSFISISNKLYDFTTKSETVIRNYTMKLFEDLLSQNTVTSKKKKKKRIEQFSQDGNRNQ